MLREAGPLPRVSTPCIRPWASCRESQNVTSYDPALLTARVGGGISHLALSHQQKPHKSL